MGCATLSFADCDGAQLVRGMGTDESGELVYHHTSERCITEYFPVSGTDTHKYHRWCRNNNIYRFVMALQTVAEATSSHQLTHGCAT